jgi:hypothetical protein
MVNKKILNKTITAVLILLFAGCFTAVARDKEDTLQKVQVIAYTVNFEYMDANIPLEQQSYLIVDRNISILSVDNKQNPFRPRPIFIIPSGMHFFQVQYTKGIIYSAAIDMIADFEAGKYYFLNYKITDVKGIFKKDSITMSAAELIGDNIPEKGKEIIDDLIENWHIPARNRTLDGNYATNYGESQITITGNKIKITDKFAMKPFIYDGTIFCFDEETMIVFVRDLNGKALPLYNQREEEILHYKLNNGILEITDAKRTSILSSINGKYYKINEDESVQSPTEQPAVIWRIENETLFISGSGDMKKLGLMEAAPWNGYSCPFTSVKIEEGITGIGNYSFRAEKKIRSVSIPSTVSKIGTSAFGGCKNLTTVEIANAIPPQMGKNVFITVSLKKATLRVPVGAKAAYEADKIWSKFGTIEEF